MPRIHTSRWVFPAEKGSCFLGVVTVSIVAKPARHSNRFLAYGFVDEFPRLLTAPAFGRLVDDRPSMNSSVAIVSMCSKT